MKIVVAIDFSDATGPMMEVVAKLSTAPATELCLVHVIEPAPAFVGDLPTSPVDFGYVAAPQIIRDQLAKDYKKEHMALQKLAEDLRSQGIKATSLMVQGPPDEVLLMEAEKLAADMIIVGSHGHGSLYHLLVGSVSEGVLHKARCPVLVVPTHNRGKNG